MTCDVETLFLNKKMIFETIIHYNNILFGMQDDMNINSVYR